MEEKTVLDIRISNKFKFVIALNNVPLELLEEKANTYTLLYKDKQNTCFITLTGASYEFIKKVKSSEKNKKSLNLAPFFIHRNNSGTVNLFFHAHLDVLPKIIHTGQPVLIEFFNKNLSLRLEMNIIPKALIREIQEGRIKFDKEQKRKNEARLRQMYREYQKEEKRGEIKELVKKIDKIEESIKGDVQIDKVLSHKGVYLVAPKSFKRCGNCANFTKSTLCSAHNLEVSENHRCSRFHAYKTFYGGSFSPK